MSLDKITTIYCYNEDNIYVASSYCQEDPTNPGVYLFPSNSTGTKLPIYNELTEFLTFSVIKNKWDINKIIPVGTYHNNSNPLLPAIVINNGAILAKDLPIDFANTYSITPPISINTAHQEYDKQNNEWVIKESIFEDIDRIEWAGYNYMIDSDVDLFLKSNEKYSVIKGTYLHNILCKYPEVKNTEIAKRRNKKLEELAVIISLAKNIKIVHNDVVFVDKLEKIQEVIIRKFTNGDFFNYDIDSLGLSLIGIDRKIANEIQSFCESTRSDIRIYLLYYSDIINKSVDPIYIDKLEFKPILLRGAEFNINEEFVFNIPKSNKIQIIKTIG